MSKIIDNPISSALQSKQEIYFQIVSTTKNNSVVQEQYKDTI